MLVLHTALDSALGSLYKPGPQFRNGSMPTVCDAGLIYWT